MKLGQAALGLVLAATTTSPAFPASAVAQLPANQNDVDTPITLLGKDNPKLTDSQKLKIDQDSVQAFLVNIRKNHPDLLQEMTDYFNTPRAEYGGESRGFHNYKLSIEERLHDGSDASKTNALSIVAASGVAYHQSRVNMPSH